MDTVIRVTAGDVLAVGLICGIAVAIIVDRLWNGDE